MTDIDARLKDMDKVKIDTQVVFPSLFLTTTAEDLRLEAALLRAYNSFLGECSAASKGKNPLCRAGADPRYRCIYKRNEAGGENWRRCGHAAWHGVG